MSDGSQSCVDTQWGSARCHTCCVCWCHCDRACGIHQSATACQRNRVSKAPRYRWSACDRGHISQPWTCNSRRQASKGCSRGTGSIIGDVGQRTVDTDGLSICTYCRSKRYCIIRTHGYRAIGRNWTAAACQGNRINKVTSYRWCACDCGYISQPWTCNSCWKPCKGSSCGTCSGIGDIGQRTVDTNRLSICTHCWSKRYSIDVNHYVAIRRYWTAATRQSNCVSKITRYRWRACDCGHISQPWTCNSWRQASKGCSRSTGSIIGDVSQRTVDTNRLSVCTHWWAKRYRIVSVYCYCNRIGNTYPTRYWIGNSQRCVICTCCNNSWRSHNNGA